VKNFLQAHHQKKGAAAALDKMKDFAAYFEKESIRLRDQGMVKDSVLLRDFANRDGLLADQENCTLQ